MLPQPSHCSSTTSPILILLHPSNRSLAWCSFSTSSSSRLCERTKILSACCSNGHSSYRRHQVASVLCSVLMPFCSLLRLSLQRRSALLRCSSRYYPGKYTSASAGSSSNSFFSAPSPEASCCWCKPRKVSIHTSHHQTIPCQ